jgi:hypothetical protein
MAENSWMDPQGFNEISRLRASDADRDTAAAVVNNALAEGRLTPEEHSDRLDAIFSAKTHAEIVPLLNDLPAAGRTGRDIAGPQPTGADLALVHTFRRGGRLVAIFGGVSRGGAWHPEPVLNVLAVFGGAQLDFREAILPGKELVLRATAVFGGLDVIVPPEMRVVDNGIAILGGRDITGNPADAASPDAPVLRIEGACVMGAINVKRRARRSITATRRA